MSDEDLHAEIELLADLIEAVTWSRCPLSCAQIDQALGVHREAA